MDKSRLVERLRDRARRELAVAAGAQRASASGVTHEESRAENDKDTRAVEASYLARGQAARVDELREVVAHLDAVDVSIQGPLEPVRAGSLVELEDEQGRSLWWLSLVGSGFDVELDGKRVRVVSTRSPLGRALLGRRLDDEVEFPAPRGKREFAITGVW